MRKRYEDVVEKLLNIPRTNKPPLEHTRLLLESLGVNMTMPNIIHVAGTNGKGSVCSYVSNILRAAGYTTGVFTSPHLVRINERISIDGIEVSDEDFVEAYEKVEEAVVGLGDYAYPTFFEYILAMAMYIFKKAQVDYIVLETGLGGRYDQTNVFIKPLVSIICSIGIDHTEFLGDTIEAIATEKAGIIKPGVPLVFYDNQPSVSYIFESTAKLNGAVFYGVKPDMESVRKDKGNIFFSFEDHIYRLNTMAEYQVINASLAVCATNHIMNIAKEHIEEGLLNALWKGRMEEIMDCVYIDGGHNEDGIQAFIRSVKGIEGSKKLLFSAVKDKEYTKIIPMLCESDLFDSFAIAPLKGYRALSKEALYEEFTKSTDKEVQAFDSVWDAFLECVNNRKEDMLFCVGSLYMVGEILEQKRG